jgi:hypothetical protein
VTRRTLTRFWYSSCSGVVLGFNQYDRDVVLTSGFIRSFDQCAGHLIGVSRVVLDQVPDISSCQLICEAVGTEQERRRLWKSEGMNLNEARIVGRVSSTSKISVHLVSARVAHGGVFAEALGVFQLTYRRVISCDLLDLSWSEEIEPRVADVPDRDLVLLDQYDCGDACHSGPLRVARCGLEDLRAGKRECLLYALVDCTRAAGQPCGDDVNRNLRCSLARCMPTEPIHNQKNAAMRVDEEAIFVLGSLPPYVGMAANEQVRSGKHGLVAAAHERPHQEKNDADESEKKRNAEPEQSGGQGSASNSKVQTSASVMLAGDGKSTSRLRSTFSPPSTRSTLLGMEAPFTVVPN